MCIENSINKDQIATFVAFNVEKSTTINTFKTELVIQSTLAVPFNDAHIIHESVTGDIKRLQLAAEQSRKPKHIDQILVLEADDAKRRYAMAELKWMVIGSSVLLS